MDTKREMMQLESQDEQIVIARSFCLFIAKKYWRSIQEKTGTAWRMRTYKGATKNLPKDLVESAEIISNELIGMEPDYAGYNLSLHYMKMLPKHFREKYGVFYTPINVVNEMLIDADRHGIDLKTAKIIDASSGGSAFLAPLCRKMIREDLDGQQVIKDIEDRLTGFEIDEFAAWLSQLLIDCELATIAPKAQKPQNIVICTDALTVPSSYYSQYDYVIGNPPYGKLGKNDFPKDLYQDVVFGAPNLYQLFYKLSFLLAKPDGFIHLVTPTGFIGGAYFKKLRSYLNEHGTAMSFSFFQKRKYVFDGVQQELVISLFKKTHEHRQTAIYSISGTPKNNLTVSKIGVVDLSRQDPWVLPKSQSELDASLLFGTCSNTLADIGYKAQTGYVVPHRSKEKLSNRKRSKSHPMVWAEAIQDKGFNPDITYMKGRQKWYSSTDNIGLIKETAILVKRTSSKEQSKRIHAALVEQTYIDSTGGFFAENHINVLTPINDTIPSIRLSSLLKLLQTRVVDSLFRCISGTVTVSTTELNLIPLPSIEALTAFENTVANVYDREEIENAALIAYEG